MDKPKIIYESNAMAKIMTLVKKIAKSSASVLILGESGTGKDLIAKTIHYYSNRKQKKFISMNCSAINEGLSESELFGHVKGSFTHAIKEKMGKFEYAHQGTIFLDEIGDMPLPIQSKILRILQNKELERTGSNKTINIDVRVISATNQNIEESIRARTFREDLYYRLAVIVIKIPPLRKRKEDVLPLANFFIMKYSIEQNKKVKVLTPRAIKLLQNNLLPGNVRELDNIIKRSVLLVDKEEISELDLNLHIPTEISTETTEISTETTEISTETTEISTETTEINKIERKLIIQTLRNNDGYQNLAAKALGISPRVISYKIKKKYNIGPIEYRER